MLAKIRDNILHPRSSKTLSVAERVGDGWGGGKLDYIS
jgi:hypothetical protein